MSCTYCAVEAPGGRAGRVRAGGREGGACVSEKEIRGSRWLIEKK
jgi:hypothetical protein